MTEVQAGTCIMMITCHLTLLSELILEIQDYNKLYKQDLKKQCNILESIIADKLKLMYGVDSESQLGIFEATNALEVRCNEIREELKQIMYNKK